MDEKNNASLGNQEATPSGAVEYHPYPTSDEVEDTSLFHKLTAKPPESSKILGSEDFEDTSKIGEKVENSFVSLEERVGDFVPEGSKRNRLIQLGKRIVRRHSPKELTEQQEKTLAWLNKTAPLLQALAAFLLVFVIEWCSRRSFTSALGFLLNSPAIYFFNALLVFVSFMPAYIVHRRTMVRVGIGLVWFALGVINGCVLSQRVTPFNFADVSLIGDLLTMKSSKYFTFAQEITAIVALVVALLILGWLFFKGPRFRGKINWLFNLILTILCVAAMPLVMKAAIHAGIMTGYFGNLAQGFQEYGFVYSFTCSVVDRGISEDENYSEEAITAINASVNVGKTKLDSNEAPNVIFVQLESFVDPNSFTFLEYSQDPAPTFHKLLEENGSGTLTVPVVGAGTANTEFEVLTGMGIRFFGLGEYPYKTVMKKTSCESAATAFSAAGYGTHALHNNTASFYGRSTVFSNMGFDSYQSKEMMDITDYNELLSWPRDYVLIDETVKALDSTSDQPDFVFDISVQGHGNYPAYQVFSNPPITVTGGEDEDENLQWTYYFNQIYEVDQFIEDFVAEMEKRDEKTLVVFYGDHLPTMGLEESDMATGSLYDTQYVTWNNFGMEFSDIDLEANQLMAYITNQLGIHEGTMLTFQQYCMDNDLVDSDGHSTNWRMLQYDLLYGERYTYGGEDKFQPSEIQMGVQDVMIDNTDIHLDEQVFTIYGSNFTPWSRVFIDDEKVATRYVSNECLEISLTNLYDGATVTVNQLGTGSTILRSSNSIVFHAPEGFDEAIAEELPFKGTSETDLMEASRLAMGDWIVEDPDSKEAEEEEDEEELDPEKLAEQKALDEMIQDILIIEQPRADYAVNKAKAGAKK